MGKDRAIQVWCYSGYKADERPIRFEVDGRRVDVTEVLDRWYGQDGDYFKVLGGDGCAYLITWRRREDVWSLAGVHPVKA